MPTLSQVTARPVSGFNHIDALIGALPWNYIGRDTIYFSFALDTSGDPNGVVSVPGTLSAFNASQQAQARAVMAYAGSVTGIHFTEVASTAAADIHFANADLKDGYTSQDRSSVSYTASGADATNVKVNEWIYLDAFDDVYDNLNPLPGGSGYEALLHEVGHALGLKHPSEGDQQLPAGNALGQDNSETSVMSLNSVGGPYTHYNVYDLAALDWLYGRDGLGGQWGVGTPGLFLTGSIGDDGLGGSAGNDKLQGNAGNDTIDGGAGIDTALYTGARGAYTVQHTGDWFNVSGPEGSDTLLNVERLLFGDGSRVALDVHGNGGIAYRLYQAALDRAPEPAGLGFHIGDLDAGVPLWIVAAHFVQSPEFQTKYGALSDLQFVQQLYLNVLHRPGEQSGVDYHLHDLQSGLARWDVLLHFSESPENQANVIGAIQDGMNYTV